QIGGPYFSRNGRFVTVAHCLGSMIVHDRTTGITTTHGIGGERPVISDDGRYLAFMSDLPTLVAGDTNGVEDVFVFDRQTGVFERVNVASDGTQANAFTRRFAMTPDARFVAFASYGSNLVPADTNAAADVFVRDRATGTTSRVSVTSGGAEGPFGASVNVYSQIAITPDGRWVGFGTPAPLAPDDTDGATDVYVHDRLGPTTERVAGS